MAMKTIIAIKGIVTKPKVTIGELLQDASSGLVEQGRRKGLPVIYF